MEVFYIQQKFVENTFMFNCYNHSVILSNLVIGKCSFLVTMKNRSKLFNVTSHRVTRHSPLSSAVSPATTIRPNFVPVSLAPVQLWTTTRSVTKPSESESINYKSRCFPVHHGVFSFCQPQTFRPYVVRATTHK